MRIRTLAAALLTILLTPSAGAPDNAPPEWFTALFDCKDLTCWKGLVTEVKTDSGIKKLPDNPSVRAKLSPEELAAVQKRAAVQHSPYRRLRHNLAAGIKHELVGGYVGISREGPGSQVAARPGSKRGEQRDEQQSQDREHGCGRWQNEPVITTISVSTRFPAGTASRQPEP